MIVQWISELGPWVWIALGLGLLAAEIVVPGVYLLWIGVAALLTGTLSFQLWDAGFWIWQVQVVVFLALSLASAIIGKKIMVATRGDDSDQPLLNRRAEQLVGRTAQLMEPIREGRGRIRLGDTQWIVTGPDLPVGTHVRVASVVDSELVVEEI